MQRFQDSLATRALQGARREAPQTLAILELLAQRARCRPFQPAEPGLQVPQHGAPLQDRSGCAAYTCTPPHLMGRKVGLPHFPQFAMALPQAQAAVWVLLAAALAYYGNGESDLLSLVLWDSRLNRLVQVLQHGCRP